MATVPNNDSGPNKNSGNEKTPPLPFANQFGLYVIAGVAILGAIGHACWPNQVDDKTAMFLALAVVALVIQQISEFSGFGITFKRLQTEVRNVKTAMSVMEQEVGPGSKRTGVSAPIAAELLEKKSDFPIDPDDPNRDQFGRSRTNNGYKLSATISPAAGRSSAACKVHFKVESTRPERPLTGKVDIYLHPSFGRWAKYDLDAVNGVVEETITSYGVFTIGVEVRQDHTRLELNLKKVKGGTPSFYKN
jgi:hypothetical protein